MGRFNGGFGGGAGNMQQLMKQAQKMQQDLLKAQEELAETEVVSTAGGGMVEVTMTCDKKLVSIKIKPHGVDPDDVEMLEDLLVAAVNEAISAAEKASEEKMGPLSGGMGLF